MNQFTALSRRKLPAVKNLFDEENAGQQGMTMQKK